MKSTFLTLLLAVQLAAVPAFAQTAATTTTTGATTGTSGAGMTSDTFGGDWSTTLGLAMFGDDGTMIRSDSELANQWALPEAPRATLLAAPLAPLPARPRLVRAP